MKSPAACEVKGALPAISSGSKRKRRAAFRRHS